MPSWFETSFKPIGTVPRLSGEDPHDRTPQSSRPPDVDPPNGGGSSSPLSPTDDPDERSTT